MILSHMAPSCFNMSPYRAIWTHFRSNYMMFEPENHISELPDFRKISPYSSGDHFSESCAPRKFMQNGIDEIFWGQTFKKTPYFNLRAADFWKPLTSDYVAQGCFSPEKKAPDFWKPPTSDYVARGYFSPRKKGPHIF